MRDEVAVVVEHRRDQARAAVRADLHVGLALVETARGDVQQREIVRLRKARHRLEDLGEAGDVFELLRQLLEEGFDVHRASLVKSGV